MNLKSVVKIFFPVLALLTGCVDLTDQTRTAESENTNSNLSTAASVTATVQNGTWYDMKAQAHDVAVGSRNWIYIINNYYDICYWQWKNGSFQPGNPSGGAWVKMATIPGGFSRVASSEYNLIAAVGRDGNVYVFNGTIWISIGHPGCGSALDVAVSPYGVVSATFSSGCQVGGLYDWNGTSWVMYVDGNLWYRMATSLTGGKLAINQYDKTVVKFYPDVQSTFKSQDLGGTDERQPRRSWNNYELWRVDTNGDIFRLYTGLFPNGTGDIVDSRWMQTNGRASNIAASKKSEVVVRQGEGRYVWFSSDFYF